MKRKRLFLNELGSSQEIVDWLFYGKELIDFKNYKEGYSITSLTVYVQHHSCPPSLLLPSPTHKLSVQQEKAFSLPESPEKMEGTGRTMSFFFPAHYLWLLLPLLFLISLIFFFC